MKTYTVRVDSSGYSADWIDDVIVVAPAENVARDLAERAIRDLHPDRDVTGSNALALTTNFARAIGVLRPHDLPARPTAPTVWPNPFERGERETP